MHSQFLTVAAVSSLLLGTAAIADVNGVAFEFIGVNLVDPADAGGDNYTVDVYAVLDDGNRLDAVAGNSTTTKLIATGGTFYQNANCGPTSTNNNDAFWSFYPSMEFDSFVTIRCLSSGCSGDNNTLQNVGIDWTSFEAGGDLMVTNGTWFITPDQPIGESQSIDLGCGDENVVRIARLTIMGLDNYVEMNALFQGRDADNVTWQSSSYGIFDYVEMEYTDCNGNGVLDGCDFLNGDLHDDNGDGVWDECEFNDCNDNGIHDGDDIANGTSEDCNGNGIPDECDIADGFSADCNGDSIPDECEEDCDGNGSPDDCDIADGNAEDCNGNGIPDSCDIANGGDANGNGELDECEIIPYQNMNTGVIYDTAAEAIFTASNGDMINALAEYINAETEVDMLGKSLYINVMDGDLNTTGEIDMGAGSVLDGGGDVTLGGEVDSDFHGTAAIEADNSINASGLIFVRSNAGLELDAPSVGLSGDSLIMPGGSLAMGGDVTHSGSMTMLGNAYVIAGSMWNDGLIRTSGTVLTDLHNSTQGEVQCGGDTVLSGSLNNDGLVTVNVGTLYILGSLTNNGTILGDVDNGPGFAGGNDPTPGDGFRVSGDYIAGADASLYMAHANWTLAVGGNVDIAINDNARFTMEDAALALTGESGDLQHLEAMSVDVDSSTDGLDHTINGHFTLGQLIVRSGATALVVDNHDNAEGGAESIYVKHLIIEAGATLDAGNRAVWYETAVIDGIAIGDIGEVQDPCPGDGDGNGVVNIDDLLQVISTFGDLCPDGCDSDHDGDGVITIDDLLIVISQFGPCE
jgi:hypothetical protein